MELQGKRSRHRATRPGPNGRVKKQQRERCIDTEIGTFPVVGVPATRTCTALITMSYGRNVRDPDQEKPLLSFYMLFTRAIARSRLALDSKRESFKLAITNLFRIAYLSRRDSLFFYSEEKVFFNFIRFSVSLLQKFLMN